MAVVTMTKKQKTDRQTISVDEAAVMLGVVRETVIRMIHRGELSGYKKTLALNSHFRVYVDTVQRVLKERESTPQK
jgi:excisionase family DNA binding protein